MAEFRSPPDATGTLAVFAYGTLLFPEVMAAVTGRAGSAVDARLEGFARRALRGVCYPGLLPCAGARVEGRLWTDVQPRELARLDEFEGRRYRRQPVRVIAQAGERNAQVYVLNATFRWLGTAADWDPARFRALHLSRYVGALGDG